MLQIFTENHLQMFATAGDVVNATGGYVNSNTGAVTEFSGKNTLTPLMKTWYDTMLLDNTKPKLVYAQFGKTQPLPAGGGKTVEWRKWNPFAKAGELQEGVIPTGQKMGQTTITGSIKQYGTFTSITDQLQLHSYDDVMGGATKLMSNSAAETQEALIRDALLTNLNVLYCDNVALDGTFKSTPTSPATMGCSTTDGYSLLTPEMVARAATLLKKNKVPTINNKYVAVIHTSVAEELRKCSSWIELHKYASVVEVFNGEIGELHGVRFIENPDAPVLGGDTYKNKAGGVTYATYFFGEDSFGIIDPAGGGLEMIVHDKSSGVGGPLNQFSTVGYKFETNGATILYPERLLRVMSVSPSYSAVDSPN